MLPQSLVVLAGAGVIVVVLWLFIDRTLLGKAVIATAANRLAARLVGIDTRAIVGFSFAMSAAIGASAGILITPITLTSYDVGTLLALKGSRRPCSAASAARSAPWSAGCCSA